MYQAPNDIDRDALQILSDAGFVWDSRLSGFRKAEGDGAPTKSDAAVIDYAFLRDQKLAANPSIDRLARRGQLLRLRILVRSLG